jgi:hypothetical protein
MTRPLSPKKSETLEIRLPHQTKTAFMARCQDEGRTASETVRRFIDGELHGAAPRRARPALWPALGQALAAAVAGLAIGAVAAPSLAQTSLAQTSLGQTAHAGTDPRAAFDRLDRNHDGVVSFDEFRAG